VEQVATTTAAARNLEQQLGTVSEAMTSKVVLLLADMRADVALRRLEHTSVSGAPVVDHGRVVGVITQRDLLVPTLIPAAVEAVPGQPPRHRVRDLMSDDPITGQADWSLARASRTLVDNGVNRLPIVDGQGRPIGILTRDDVLRALARRVPAAQL
jgi:predicted transcriptional regulator